MSISQRILRQGRGTIFDFFRSRVATTADAGGKSSDAWKRSLEIGEARFAQLFEQTYDGVIIAQDHRIVSANPAFARMLGHEPDQVAGMAFARFVSPAHLATFVERFDRRIAGLDPPSNYAIDLMRTDGTSVPCLLRPQRFQHDDRTAILGVFTDLSEIQRTSEQLTAKTALLETTFANMLHGMLVLDAQARILAFNASAMETLRLPPGLVRVGTNFRDIARFCAERGDYGPGDPATLVDQRLERMLAPEFLFEKKTATGRTIEVSGKRLPNGGSLAIYRDTTDRKALEDQLRQAQKLEAIGQLTGGLAHDFNNILAAMMMTIENVADELPADAPEGPRLHGALEIGRRGADLVAKLMTFARRRQLDPVEVAIADLLRDMAGLVRTAISSRIALTMDIAPDLSRCRIDRSGFDTTILNLCVNARDAMPDGGALTITARNRAIVSDELTAHPELKAGDWIEVAVRDTGTGMPPEIVARVFEPLFTTKGEGEGTGFGLAMAHGFVHQSGGFLTVSSLVGSGTNFSVFLPAIGDTPS